MATSFKTPGVYVEEISTFPPSVAQVETAIPAFIGYTEKAFIDGINYHDGTGIIKPIKISSLPDFEFLFGAAPDPTTIEVDLKSDNSVNSANINGVNLLYDTIRMFYINGGGACFIVSVGAHRPLATPVNKDKLIEGLNSLEKVDEPTLLVIPETVHLSDSYAGEVHAAMLSQCNKLQDRFAVLDIVNGDKEATPSLDPVDVFRNNVGMNNLKYGAAYYPWIKTTLSFKIDYDAIILGDFTKEGSPVASIKSFFNSTLIDTIDNKDLDIVSAAAVPSVLPVVPGTPTLANLPAYASTIFDYFKEFFDLTFVDNDPLITSSSAAIHARYVKDGSAFHNLLKTFYDYMHYSDTTNGGPSPWAAPGLGDISVAPLDPAIAFPSLTFGIPSNIGNNIFPAAGTAVAAAPFFEILQDKLNALVQIFRNEISATRSNTTDTLGEVDAVYRGILTAIRLQNVILPPSGAMVGIYAYVDDNRGVWKAPANVSITAVSGPTVNISHEEQEGLNVDVVAGKSVNAIRPFKGKGTMVWGARTLAGNDNEWRYVPVRRFFNMAEESIKKASEQFVFEPNDANTWVKVRAMIENFLILQWRAGALAGAKPDDAFYVRVGLGETMTADDILNGLMNIEIGMAVVRPAEFIVLKFSHKMQE
jgi:phage tail sheath protein FI